MNHINTITAFIDAIIETYKLAIFYFGITCSPVWRFFECKHSKTNVIPHSRHWTRMWILEVGEGTHIGESEQKLVSHYRDDTRMSNVRRGGEGAKRSTTMFLYLCGNNAFQHTELMLAEARRRRKPRIK